MSSLISIIVPVYNVEKYLARCIESLMNQTYKNIEILLINDGSPDNSLSICNKYANKDRRIKVINKKNGGLSDARNTGIDNSIGEYIVFVDSDDWVDEYYIEMMYLAMNNVNSDISMCEYSIDYINENYSVHKNFEDLNEYSSDIREFIYNLDKKGMINVVWNKMYRYDIIKRNKIIFDINGMPGEDLLFNCEYFKYIKNIALVRKSLYHYMRQDEETILSKYNDKLNSRIIKFNESREALYTYYEMNSPNELKLLSDKYISYIFSAIVNMYRTNCPITFKEKTVYFKNLLEDSELTYHMKRCSTTSLYIRILKILWHLKCPTVNNILFTVLFKLRYSSESYYKIFRKKCINS